MSKILGLNGQEIKSRIESDTSEKEAPTKISAVKLAEMEIPQEDLLVISMAFLLDFMGAVSSASKTASEEGLKISKENLADFRQLLSMSNAIVIPLLSDVNVDYLSEKFGIEKVEAEEASDLEFMREIISKTREYTQELISNIITTATEKKE